MYLSILLIIITILIFYNELDWKHMNIGELFLLLFAFMAIVIAAVNYMKLEGKYQMKEGFVGTTLSNNSNKKNTSNTGADLGKDVGKDVVNDRIGFGSHYDNTLIKVMDHELKDQVQVHDAELKLISSRTGEYLDPNVDTNSEDSYSTFERIAPFQNISNKSNSSLINAKHIESVNNLLKGGNLNLKPSKPYKSSGTEKFNDAKNEENIRSMFAPQMIIGDSKRTTQNSTQNSTEDLSSSMSSSLSSTLSWDNVYKNAGDGMTFNNTMAPVSNLWSDDNGSFNEEKWDQGNNWSQGLSAYSKGQWKTDMYLKPSDWANLPQGAPTGGGNPPNVAGIRTPQVGGVVPTTTASSSPFLNIIPTPTTMPTPTTPSQNTESPSNKLCGTYDDLNLSTDESGNILIGNYTKAKKYFPGYTYIPPIYWDVPQRHTPVCAQPDVNVRKLTGLMDRGTPINALELNQDGTLSDTEQNVSLTNVGSLMPKFNYYEVPFSQPYV